MDALSLVFAFNVAVRYEEVILHEHCKFGMFDIENIIRFIQIHYIQLQL